MPDFARHLPLSQRRAGDEAHVGSDRRPQLAGVVEQAAALIGAARGRRSERASAFVVAARLRPEYDHVEEADPVLRLSRVAGTVRTGRRRSIRALALGVRALLELAREMERPVELEPLTAGAVALYASTTAPLERRAVVRGHAVRASDADWSFGRGPELVAPGTGIAAFLLGVSDDPPRRPGVTPPG